MKYMLFVSSAENQGPPPPQLDQAIAESGEREMAAGKLVYTGGLGRSAASAPRRASPASTPSSSAILPRRSARAVCRPFSTPQRWP